MLSLSAVYAFPLLTTKLCPLGWGGVMKFTNSCLLDLQILYTEFGRIGLASSS